MKFLSSIIEAALQIYVLNKRRTWRTYPTFCLSKQQEFTLLVIYFFT